MDTAERKPTAGRPIVNGRISPDLNAPDIRGISAQRRSPNCVRSSSTGLLVLSGIDPVYLFPQ
jgi:hypothetical protein